MINKKLKLDLEVTKALLTKEQMKQIVGGYDSACDQKPCGDTNTWVCYDPFYDGGIWGNVWVHKHLFVPPLIQLMDVVCHIK